MRKNIRGQSTVEYALIVGVIVAALVAMQTYVKRQLQGRYRDGATFLTSETDKIGTTGQYEPYYLESSYDSSQTRSASESLGARGQINRTGINEESTRSVGGSDTYKNTIDAD